MIDQSLVLIIVVPFFVFALFAGIAIIIWNNQKKRDSALQIIRGQSNQGMDSSLNEEQRSARRRADLAKKLRENEEKEKKSGSGQSYQELIEQAGLGISLQLFFGICFALIIVAALAGFVFNLKPYLVLMIAIIAGLGIPRLVLKFFARRRQKRFLNEFADALETIVRMLKAGMPVIESIAMVSREFEGPVQEEMSRIYDEQKVGTPLYEAVQNAARRMPLTEMQMFATAIAIQQQTGASLSEVLSNLARVIRARFALKRKVVALSAEAKYSAGIIGALPVFVTAALYVMNPEYISLLFTDSFGNMLLATGFGWMMIGIFIMRQMINFKV